jgi:hypothetical protein
MGLKVSKKARSRMTATRHGKILAAGAGDIFVLRCSGLTARPCGTARQGHIVESRQMKFWPVRAAGC